MAGLPRVGQTGKFEVIADLADGSVLVEVFGFGRFSLQEAVPSQKKPASSQQDTGASARSDATCSRVCEPSSWNDPWQTKRASSQQAVSSHTQSASSHQAVHSQTRSPSLQRAVGRGFRSTLPQWVLSTMAPSIPPETEIEPADLSAAGSAVDFTSWDCEPSSSAGPTQTKPASSQQGCEPSCHAVPSQTKPAFSRQDIGNSAINHATCAVPSQTKPDASRQGLGRGVQYTLPSWASSAAAPSIPSQAEVHAAPASVPAVVSAVGSHAVGRGARPCSETSAAAPSIPSQTATAVAPSATDAAKPSGSDPDSGLADGWEAYIDPVSGRTWWWHGATESCRWDRP